MTLILEFSLIQCNLAYTLKWPDPVSMQATHLDLAELAIAVIYEARVRVCDGLTPVGI